MPARLLIFTLLPLAILTSGCRQKTESQTAPSDPPETRLTAASFDEAQRLLRVGIAHLENSKWADGETAFQSLLQLLPGNRTALRNRAVLRVLSIIDPASPLQPGGSPQQQREYSEAVAQARSAISAWHAVAKTDDEQTLASLLRGKLLVTADRTQAPSFEDGLQELQHAVSLQPRRPDLNMALVQAMSSRRELAESAELLTLLQRTLELAPDNLYVLQRLLQQHGLALRSSNEDARTLAQSSVRSTLQAAVPLLQPLQAPVMARAQVDLRQLLQDALQNPQADPASYIRPAMYAANLMAAEIPVQIDQRRIDRHLLEYVQQRFDADLTDSFQQTTLGEEAAISVLNGFDSSPQPVAGLTDVTDLHVGDVTLNGISDLIVVRNGTLEVYTRTAADSDDWRLLMETPQSTDQWTSLLLADIDRDTEPVGPGPIRPQILEDRDQDRRVPTPRSRRVDTDPDFIVWNRQALQIWRNSSSDSDVRTLEPVARFDLPKITDAVAADADADGDLDIFVATLHGIQLLTNINGSNFEQRAVSSEPVDRLAIGDVDRNVAIDVAGISSQSGPGLLQNLFHSRFRWLPAEDVFGAPTSGSAIAIGDYDTNLSWDVVCGGPAGLTVQLTRSSAPGVVLPLSIRTLIDQAIDDFIVADLDNDGHPDIAALTESGLRVLRGFPDGEFVPLYIETSVSQGMAIRSADVDEDGDLDLLVIDSSGSVRLLTNDGGNRNNWLKIVVRGTDHDDQFRSRRVNMHGVGTVLEVMAGDNWQTQIVTEPVVHVGLGQAGRPDAIRLLWPNGVPQNIVTDELLRSNVCILAPQILKGSCPYIYTWNGQEFEFFSDCLWAAPIGLVQASGDLAPTRDWENLLIPGHLLAERNGEYLLQITEELWEIAYFDQVELLAIDHPQEVQVFTNEKVGPPNLAQHRVHTVHQPLTPPTVIDGHGNDLLPALKEQDDVYAQAFSTRRVQGLTDEWTMEFDLGPQVSTDSVRLFLTGWIFPTDTSLNLQIHQNPDLPPPMPPVIELRQADGSWKTVVPFFGFPSGKTKTMVVDLTDVVGPDHTQFRLRSTMELYFDQVFFTAGEHEQPTNVQECRLIGADLHFRGFSRRRYAGSVFRDGYGPERYDYQRATTDPRWPTISGAFTRYGGVDELLRTADDRLAVLGPGDEMTLRFAAPDTPAPPSWTRSFVLRNIGWDKDADLNTVYGQSTEPYPCRGMSRYPFAESDALPDSDVYRQYRKDYQTREYVPRRFRGLLRDQAANDTPAATAIP